MYCSPVWRPQFIKDIKVIERVQRRATKFILDDYRTDYKSRLTSLNMLPLMMQFELNDIIFFVSSLKNPTDSFNILVLTTLYVHVADVPHPLSSLISVHYITPAINQMD